MRPANESQNPHSVVPLGPNAAPFPGRLEPPPKPRRTLTKVVGGFLGSTAMLSLLVLIILACVCAARRLVIWGWQ